MLDLFFSWHFGTKAINLSQKDNFWLVAYELQIDVLFGKAMKMSSRNTGVPKGGMSPIKSEVPQMVFFRLLEACLLNVELLLKLFNS